MANNTILANLHTVSNFKCANDCVFVDVNIVTDGHLDIFESTLILLIGWSDNTLFSYYDV